MGNRTALKRNDILDTAATLFAQRGYQGTNMKLLASEAQASTSTIYSYFEDKVDLLNQSIEHRLERLEAELLELQRGIDDPVDALLRGVTLLNTSVAADPLLSGLLVYDAHVADVRLSTHASRVIQRIDEHCVGLVQEAVRQGVIDFDEPKLLVKTLRLAFQGWLLNRSRGGNDLTEAQLTRTVKRLILGLIRDE